MKHTKNDKRFTLLGVLVLVLLALIGLAAMGIMLQKQDMKHNWRTENIVTLEGELGCLPPKNPDQPQTLECAAGLKVNDVYYALRYDNSTVHATTGRALVTGVYSAPANNDRYDTVGTLEVKTITKK